MKTKLMIFTIMVVVSIYIACPVFCGDPPGTAYSRPNVSGGYDFYDSSGNKIGFSSGRPKGGYDYYDQYGNKAGHIELDPKTGRYRYYDAENIRGGELVTDPYGGYRYKEWMEDQITPTQKGIRRDYKYANPYGSGIETLPPDIIQGRDSGSTDTTRTGLEFSTSGTQQETATGKTGLELSGSGTE